MSTNGSRAGVTTPKALPPGDSITVRQLAGAFIILQPFMSDLQHRSLVRKSLAPDSDALCAKLMAVSQFAAIMPRFGEQAGRGREALAYLHYVLGEQHWYILERTDPDPSQNLELVGYAISDGSASELRQISSKELTTMGAELDPNFEPCMFREIETAGFP